MSKFPILNLYRTLFNIGALLVIIVGVLTAISDTTSSKSGFNLGSWAASFIPFLGVSVGLAFLAEVIKLALTIEKHLERIANK